MKKVTYAIIGGGKKTIEYDDHALCISCKLPVIDASMGGTVLCPWCDCGNYRDGTRIETFDKELLRKIAEEIWARMNKNNPSEYYKIYKLTE